VVLWFCYIISQSRAFENSQNQRTLGFWKKFGIK
jgi:hypothetical protein